MHTQIEFPYVVVKPWGREIWFANNAAKNYCGKELVIEHGWQLSLHRHMIKDEVFYVLAGKVYVETSEHNDGSNRKHHVLHAGDRLHIPTGLWHRMRAEDSQVRIIEASTFHDDGDVERLETSRYCGAGGD